MTVALLSAAQPETAVRGASLRGAVPRRRRVVPNPLLVGTLSCAALGSWSLLDLLRICEVLVSSAGTYMKQLNTGYRDGNRNLYENEVEKTRKFENKRKEEYKLTDKKPPNRSPE